LGDWAALAPLCEWGTLHMNRIEARKEAIDPSRRPTPAPELEALVGAPPPPRGFAGPKIAR
jgi:hypothetical protein